MRPRRTGRGPIRAAFLVTALCLGGARLAHADVVPPPVTVPEDPNRLRSQRYEIGGFFGYGWGGDFNQVAGHVNFDTGEAYAGLLAIRIGNALGGGFFGEFMYSRRPSTLTFQPASAGGASNPDVTAGAVTFTDIGIEYYQLGFTYRWYSPVIWLTPLVGASLGASRVDAVTGQIDDSWQFAWAGFAGAQFELHPNFALRAQMRVLMTDVVKGREIYCGSTPDCTNTTRSVVSVQGEATGGLIVKF